jgi:hypothetical protein
MRPCDLDCCSFLSISPAFDGPLGGVSAALMFSRVGTVRLDSGRRIRDERDLAAVDAVSNDPAPLRRSTARRPLS